MSKWKIELQAIGRGKVTRSLIVYYATLPLVERRALRECSKHLASNDIALSTPDDLTYRVLAGGNLVGEVTIQTILSERDKS